MRLSILDIHLLIHIYTGHKTNPPEYERDLYNRSITKLLNRDFVKVVNAKLEMTQKGNQVIKKLLKELENGNDGKQVEIQY